MGARAMRAITPNPLMTASEPVYSAAATPVYNVLITATDIGPVATPPASKAMPAA